MRQQLPVEIEPVVLDFEIEVVLPENVEVGVGEASPFLVAFVEQGFVQIASQASGGADQPLRFLSQQLFVDARFVVEAFEVTGRDEIDQITVACEVFAQQ